MLFRLRLALTALVRICAAAIPIALSGCYESAEPLVTSGEYVDLAGSYTCRSKIDGRESHYAFTQVKSGWIPLLHTYAYRSDHAETMSFKSLHDGLYLAQVKPDRDAVFRFVFAKFRPMGLDLYVPNVMQQSALLDSWLRETGARADSSSPEHIRLVGDHDRSLAFLAKHDLTALTPLADCGKT